MSESNEPAIMLQEVGKMYKVFSSRFDNFLDAVGMNRMMPWRGVTFREFWAVRDIDISVQRGKRLGIIGCNGAGKTTLLKLITGNLAPTEGTLNVKGHVHALMSTGAGFHPEFTGRENIEASLIYQGFSSRAIKEACEEIAEFTELGSFLDQPFKTYSAGMQARLTFATATTLTPDILIVDEVLGAGDGYFIAKSSERITRLVEETGATVLLVSHALDQIVRFCEETIWLDRGRIVQRGPTLEVVKAYEQFLRVRNERRLRAKNKLRGSSGQNLSRLGMYNNNIVLRFVVEGEVGSTCDVADITLHENGEMHETLKVGDAQDSDLSRPAFVQLEQEHSWTSPRTERKRHFRSVAVSDEESKTAAGSVAFYFYGMFEDLTYAADVAYRCAKGSTVRLEVEKDGQPVCQTALEPTGEKWKTLTLSLPIKDALPVAADVHVEGSINGAIATESSEDASGLAAVQGQPNGEPVAGRSDADRRAARRWPSGGDVLIQSVSVCGPNQQEQAVFAPGQAVHIRIGIEAQTDGEHAIRGAVSIFRLDGILVSHVLMPEAITLSMDNGQRKTLTLTIDPLNLGAGQYVFSVALFGNEINEKDRHDLIDRAYEFEVTSTQHVHQGTIFVHDGQWRAD